MRYLKHKLREIIFKMQMYVIKSSDGILKEVFKNSAKTTTEHHQLFFPVGILLLSEELSQEFRLKSSWILLKCNFRTFLTPWVHGKRRHVDVATYARCHLIHDRKISWKKSRNVISACRCRATQKYPIDVGVRYVVDMIFFNFPIPIIKDLLNNAKISW